MIVRVKQKAMFELTIPFVDYSAVRIGKTNILDKNIQNVYERLG